MPFTNEPWNAAAVEAKLSAEDYAKVCLIDLNKPGEKKIKALCKLPVRATPNGPYNTNAIRNAMARIFQVVDVPADKKRAAARKLVSLAREAKIEIGSEALLRLAGMRST